jgi:hypothetical protein
MKLLDICVIDLVSVVYLSRLPSPLRSLKSDLIAKSNLTLLSAVCQLVGTLVACDYFRSATLTNCSKSSRMERGQSCWLAFFWLSSWTGLPIFSIKPALKEVSANPAV